jgi:hypothetical protein
MITATTRRMWIKEPRTGKARKPRSHKTIRTIAIVESIYFLILLLIKDPTII